MLTQHNRPAISIQTSEKCDHLTPTRKSDINNVRKWVITNESTNKSRLLGANGACRTDALQAYYIYLLCFSNLWCKKRIIKNLSPSQSGNCYIRGLIMNFVCKKVYILALQMFLCSFGKGGKSKKALDSRKMELHSCSSCFLDRRYEIRIFFSKIRI